MGTTKTGHFMSSFSRFILLGFHDSSHHLVALLPFFGLSQFLLSGQLGPSLYCLATLQIVLIFMAHFASYSQWLQGDVNVSFCDRHSDLFLLFLNRKINLSCLSIHFTGGFSKVGHLLSMMANKPG